MITLTPKNKLAALLFSLISLSLLLLGRADEMNAAGPGAKENKIEIKDFAFNPQTITVRSGQKITWINHDEEPHTVVSVGKKFQKSSALDTDQEFAITAGAPGTYEDFCSVHPKMTGTIVVVKP
jgi:plastocyanin